LYKTLGGKKNASWLERFLISRQPALALALAARREEWDASGLL
jgi:hypothetical protein